MQEYIRCRVPHLKCHNQLTTSVKTKKTQKNTKKQKHVYCKPFYAFFQNIIQNNNNIIYYYYFDNIQMSVLKKRTDLIFDFQWLAGMTNITYHYFGLVVSVEIDL